MDVRRAVVGLLAVLLGPVPACAGPTVGDPCGVIVVQMHDLAAEVQEYEVVEAPYRVEMSSRDQSTRDPLAHVSLYADGWAPGRLDVRHTYPGEQPIDSWSDTSVLSTDGLGFIFPEPGQYHIELRGGGCEAAVGIEVVPDAGTWEPGDAETYEEFDFFWRRDSE